MSAASLVLAAVRRGSRGEAPKKAPVVALVGRGGAARAMSVRRVNAATLKPAIRQHVDRSAKVVTDEWSAYTGLDKEFAGGHATVNHGAGEYARADGAHTNTVESYFALLKRGIHGIYHHIGTQYLDQYLAEFSFRYSTRKFTDGERTRAGMAKVAGKRLMLRRPESTRRAYDGGQGSPA